MRKLIIGVLAIVFLGLAGCATTTINPNFVFHTGMTKAQVVSVEGIPDRILPIGYREYGTDKREYNNPHAYLIFDGNILTKILRIPKRIEIAFKNRFSWQLSVWRYFLFRMRYHDYRSKK